MADRTGGIGLPTMVSFNGIKPPETDSIVVNKDLG